MSGALGTVLTCCWVIAFISIGSTAGRRKGYGTHRSTVEARKFEICTLPRVVGDCRGSLRRWHHNASSGRCEVFVFGGCHGNYNNFPSRSKCEEICVENRCFLPTAPGICKAKFPMYSYNDLTKECEIFTYGGCRGNRNNFRSYSVCMKSCSRIKK